MFKFHFLNILFKDNLTVFQIYGGLILFLIRDYFIIFSHVFVYLSVERQGVIQLQRTKL